jgi:hypothetical protein
MSHNHQVIISQKLPGGQKNIARLNKSFVKMQKMGTLMTYVFQLSRAK